MKRLLLIVLCVIGLSSVSRAQFSIADTVRVWVNSALNFNDFVTYTGSDSTRLYWKVAATNFPSDWNAALSICDNYNCYTNTGGAIWNGLGGSTFRSSYYKPGIGDFHMVNNFATVSVGTYYLTVRLTDSTGNIKYSTFLISRAPASVPSTVKNEDDVTLYPNPAVNELNVVFNADAGVKTIVVSNLIGKTVSVFKVNGNSASLDVENLPAGVYFVRLINMQGYTIATRKFNKQ